VLRVDMHRRGDVTTKPDFQESPQAAAAPERSARRAAGRAARMAAAALLIAVAGSAAWLASFTWRHRVADAARDTAPFALSDSAWRLIRTVAKANGESCPPRVPVAVLYVSRSCVHCEAELERWAGLVRQRAGALACVGVAVVAPFAQRAGANDWPPAELAPVLLWDRDGSIGRALDARLVPVAAFVTSTGVVSVRSVGESSEAATLDRFRSLRSLSTIAH
ncbi:MAG: hypothetical protein ACREN6_01865, partial [Gemmatimonadaceae bacterium]